MLYVNPIFCLIGVFISVLTIKCLSTIPNNTNDFGKFYRYLKINSYLNIIFVVITSLKILKDCTNWDLFCSLFYNSVYAIIIVKLIGNSVQTASNLAHVSFTLSRFIAITSTKSKYLLIFDKISLKLYLATTISTSLLINLHVCFEYYNGSTILELSTYSKQRKQTSGS